MPSPTAETGGGLDYIKHRDDRLWGATQDYLHGKIEFDEYYRISRSHKVDFQHIAERQGSLGKETSLIGWIRQLDLTALVRRLGLLDSWLWGYAFGVLIAYATLGQPLMKGFTVAFGAVLFYGAAHLLWEGISSLWRRARARYRRRTLDTVLKYFETGKPARLAKRNDLPHFEAPWVVSIGDTLYAVDHICRQPIFDDSEEEAIVSFRTIRADEIDRIPEPALGTPSPSNSCHIQANFVSFLGVEDNLTTLVAMAESLEPALDISDDVHLRYDIRAK